jgi:hypothetical protein
LEDKANIAPRPFHAKALQEYAATRWPTQTSDQPQKRRFSATTWTNDSQKLPGHHIKGDFRKRLDRLRALSISHRNVANADRCCISHALHPIAAAGYHVENDQN